VYKTDVSFKRQTYTKAQAWIQTHTTRSLSVLF